MSTYTPTCKYNNNSNNDSNKRMFFCIFFFFFLELNSTNRFLSDGWHESSISRKHPATFRI